MSLDNPVVAIRAIVIERELGVDTLLSVLSKQYGFCYTHSGLFVGYIVAVLRRSLCHTNEQPENKRAAHNWSISQTSPLIVICLF